MGKIEEPFTYTVIVVGLRPTFHPCFIASARVANSFVAFAVLQLGTFGPFFMAFTGVLDVYRSICTSSWM